MLLLRFELKKLARLPMLWVFLALSLALNGILIASAYSSAPWLAFVADAVQATGPRTDAPAFAEGLAALPESALRDALAAQTAAPWNALEGYDAAALGAVHAQMLGLTGPLTEVFAAKYEKLQPVTDAIAASGAPYDLYAGEATHDLQAHLTGVVYHAVLTEGILLAVLLTLFSLGYEVQNRTDLLVYATKAGRHITGAKLGASLLAGLACYAALLLLTLVPFALLFHLKAFLSMNVSSSFNYVQMGLIAKPFLTWRSFTLGQYLAATAALGALLIVVFALFAAVCGLLCRNTYFAFLLWFVCAAGMLALAMFCADKALWHGYFTGMFLPVPLWYEQQLWFTELGGNALIPWQETVGVLANALLFAALTLLAARRFHRKDLT